MKEKLKDFCFFTRAYDMQATASYEKGHCLTTARKRSWGQGNIFSTMCQEFCSWWGGIPACITGGIPACLAVGG